MEKVVAGCIPIVIVGLPLDMILEDYLSGVYVIAATLILYGIAFIVIESRASVPSMNTLQDLTYKTAFYRSLPGSRRNSWTSRSGATILGAVLLGCSRYVASEFSFFLAVPVMAGASGLKLLKYFLKEGMFSGPEWFLLIIGTLVSFIVSIFAIRLLLGYIRNHDFKGVRCIQDYTRYCRDYIFHVSCLERVCVYITYPHADKDKSISPRDNGSALQGYAFYSLLFIIVWIEISSFPAPPVSSGTLPQSSVPHRTVHRTAHKMHAPAHKATYKKLQEIHADFFYGAVFRPLSDRCPELFKKIMPVRDKLIILFYIRRINPFYGPSPCPGSPGGIH